MEYIWDTFRRSRAGRLLAAAIIAGLIGALATVEIAPTTTTILLSSFGAAMIGVLAVGILEWRDHSRKQSPEWRRRVEHTAAQIRQLHPAAPSRAVQTAAQEHEEQRLTPLAWCGMALGGFCIMCGIAMLILRVVQFFKTP